MGLFSKKATTSYELGYQKGRWTREELEQCGWESAEECLANSEQNYAEDIADGALYPGHLEFRQGHIDAARETLGKIIEQDKRPPLLRRLLS